MHNLYVSSRVKSYVVRILISPTLISMFRRVPDFYGYLKDLSKTFLTSESWHILWVIIQIWLPRYISPSSLTHYLLYSRVYVYCLILQSCPGLQHNIEIVFTLSLQNFSRLHGSKIYAKFEGVWKRARTKSSRDPSKVRKY